VLHRDGRLTHEGHPILHARLRAVLESSVQYAEAEDAFVVRLGRFRARVEVEGTPFFVRSFDPRDASIGLSDRTREPLAASTLRADGDGALLCTVKGRFPARFTHAAQAELLAHVDLAGEALVLAAAGRQIALPEAISGEAADARGRGESSRERGGGRI
jgi:hypothetical protein